MIRQKKLPLYLEHALEKLKEKKNIVLVGAGEIGIEMLDFLNSRGLNVLYFFDNDEKKIGKEINGINILKPYNIESADVMYFISVGEIDYRKDLLGQLLALKIPKEQIWEYDWEDCEYLRSMPEDEYKQYIGQLYYRTFNRELNWNHPVRYTEKINWEKLYVHDDRRTQYADKYLAKEIVGNKIGKQYIVKLYDVWDDAEAINFNKLPNQFVLKMNNASGKNFVIKDKSKIDERKIRATFKAWMEINYGYVAGLSLSYKDIVPKIICEEYLPGVAEEVYDYQFYCFHGEPKYIWCINGSHRENCKASFYDLEWNIQPFSFGYPKDNVVAPKPEHLDEMLKISRILSQDFTHVRVDLYDLPNRGVLFGEMSFASWGGLKEFNPDEYDIVFGNLI